MPQPSTFLPTCCAAWCSTPCTVGWFGVKNSASSRPRWRPSEDSGRDAYFGLAGTSDTLAADDDDAVCGTPIYFAPEQARGRTSPAVDQYAWGTVAWEALGQRRPTRVPQIGWLKRVGPRFPYRRPIARPIRKVLERALEIDPNCRFHDLEHALAALEPASQRRKRTMVAVVGSATALWTTSTVVRTTAAVAGSGKRLEENP